MGNKVKSANIYTGGGKDVPFMKSLVAAAPGQGRGVMPRQGKKMFGKKKK
jgi:hypothetical protein